MIGRIVLSRKLFQDYSCRLYPTHGFSSTSYFRQKPNFGLMDDSKVILRIKSEQDTEYTYRELKEVESSQEGKKLLVLVKEPGSSKKNMPLFRLMSIGELEHAVRTARKDYSDIKYVTEKHGKVKEKIKILTKKMSKTDLDHSVSQLKKWIDNGCIITVELSGDNSLYSNIKSTLIDYNVQLGEPSRISFKEKK